ncbi:YegS/Rv2252/BmrU family lipid kinase [Flavobacterium sp. 9]|uniref:diacylglycerol/lipid kinase family protein n=1 Tax=Flavobacterium sp. 9 TaxID=2035198 RepID=UPI000C1971E4|nr:YegS/Rv2252/BmrU family lipid kinase [Flavobacterium sp. 9]PIF30176.1 YegS/Rv2252/BmrU family lipid kinase [Flavobacterium sp. 9]
MIYIHFIVNPISGKGNNTLCLSRLKKILPEAEFNLEVTYTQYKKHAILLTQNILRYKPDYIIACGGDGTINEIASSLVGTTTILGIIPMGSGNGLAAHLNIPKDIEKAIEIIKRGNQISIDLGKANDRYFFSSMGIGVDSLIIKKYEKSALRMRKAYAIAAFKAILQFKARNYVLFLDKETIQINPYLFFISNTNEMGYKLTLTPKANLEDGWLDLIIVPELSLLQRILLLGYLFAHKIEHYKKAKHLLIQNLVIEMPEVQNIEAQIDGEIYPTKTNTLTVSIVKKGLSVIVNGN